MRVEVVVEDTPREAVLLGGTLLAEGVVRTADAAGGVVGWGLLAAAATTSATDTG